MKPVSERFDRAYDALVQAFFKGTLASSNCVACAIGNIVAAAKNGIIKKMTASGYNNDVFVCIINGKPVNNHFWFKILHNSIGLGEKTFLEGKQSLIDLTGYSIEELLAIEKAFERNCHISSIFYYEHSYNEIIADQFNGLQAVLDVLLSFEDQTVNPQEYKDKFKEHPKLQLA